MFTSVSLSTPNNSCEEIADVTITTTDTLVHDLAIFYLKDPVYTQNQLVTGNALGNDISVILNATGPPVTGNFNYTLVETQEDGTFIQDLDVIQFTGIEQLEGNIDLSGLTGIVTAGNSWGIKISMSSSEVGENDLGLKLRSFPEGNP